MWSRWAHNSTQGHCSVMLVWCVIFKGLPEADSYSFKLWSREFQSTAASKKGLSPLILYGDLYLFLIVKYASFQHRHWPHSFIKCSLASNVPYTVATDAKERLHQHIWKGSKPECSLITYTPILTHRCLHTCLWIWSYNAYPQLTHRCLHMCLCPRLCLLET
jgi:hypothetical protein